MAKRKNIKSNEKLMQFFTRLPMTLIDAGYFVEADLYFITKQ